MNEKSQEPDDVYDLTELEDGAFIVTRRKRWQEDDTILEELYRFEADDHGLAESTVKILNAAAAARFTRLGEDDDPQRIRGRDYRIEVPPRPISPIRWGDPVDLKDYED